MLKYTDIKSGISGNRNDETQRLSFTLPESIEAQYVLIEKFDTYAYLVLAGVEIMIEKERLPLPTNIDSSKIQLGSNFEKRSLQSSLLSLNRSSTISSSSTSDGNTQTFVIPIVKDNFSHIKIEAKAFEDFEPADYTKYTAKIIVEFREIESLSSSFVNLNENNLEEQLSIAVENYPVTTICDPALNDSRAVHFSLGERILYWIVAFISETLVQIFICKNVCHGRCVEDPTLEVGAHTRRYHEFIRGKVKGYAPDDKKKLGLSMLIKYLGYILNFLTDSAESVAFFINSIFNTDQNPGVDGILCVIVKILKTWLVTFLLDAIVSIDSFNILEELKQLFNEKCFLSCFLF